MVKSEEWRCPAATNPYIVRIPTSCGSCFEKVLSYSSLNHRNCKDCVTHSVVTQSLNSGQLYKLLRAYDGGQSLLYSHLQQQRELLGGEGRSTLGLKSIQVGKTVLKSEDAFLSMMMSCIFTLLWMFLLCYNSSVFFSRSRHNMVILGANHLFLWSLLWEITSNRRRHLIFMLMSLNFRLTLCTYLLGDWQ